MKNMPTLRFPEYKDEWNNNKLEDFVKEMRGGAPLTPDDILKNGDFVIIPKKSIQAGGKLKLNDCSYVLKGIYDKYKSNHIDKNYAIVVLRDLVPSAPSIGYIVENDIVDAGILAQGVYGILFNNIYPKFIIQYSNSPQYRALMQKIKVGSTQVHIRNTTYLSINIPNPSLDEQQKIADFLSNVDELINASEDEITKLIALKKGMLQKMFPKQGEKVPEIRFPGFTGDWEQRKLSELTTMHARIGWQNLRTSEFLDSGDYMLITGTDFNDGKINYNTCHYVTKERYEQDKHIQIHDGSILITKDGTLGKVAYVEGLTKPATLNAGVFNVEIQSEEVDSKYLFQYLKAPFLLNYVMQRATGGTIKHLNQNILVDFPIFMPSKQEQVQIGTYFSNLDDLITLHQQERDKYRELKKGLLQQMFI